MSRTIGLVISGFGRHKPFLMTRHEYTGEVSDGQEFYSLVSNLTILVKYKQGKHAAVWMTHSHLIHDQTLTEFFSAEIAEGSYGKKANLRRLQRAFASQGWAIPHRDPKTPPEVADKYKKILSRFLTER